MGSQLKVDSRGCETRQHGSYDFPVNTGRVRISGYENCRFCPHWHKDPELTIILEGEMHYQVNDRVYHLTAGQAIFVNSNCLHSAWNESGECIYLPINFDPVILFDYNDSRIYRNYVEPILNSPAFTELIIDPENDSDGSHIISRLTPVHSMMKEKSVAYELRVFGIICDTWAYIAPRALRIIEESGGARVTKQVSRMKNAINYIEKNYTEQITLANLASVCNLSRSELCRCFKNIMRQSPMDYVTSVRIRKSLPLLASNEYSVTQIAEMCGFSGSSYFAEMFKRYMSCTPSQYTKKITEGK